MAKLVSNRKMAAVKHLAVADLRLAVIIKSIGACEIKLRKDPFQSLVETIICQQLAGGSADAIYGRFVKIYGRFPRPLQLLATKYARLRTAGLSSRKIEYLKDLAMRVSDGRLKLGLLLEMPDDQVIEQLENVKGHRQVDSRDVSDLLPWQIQCASGRRPWTA